MENDICQNRLDRTPRGFCFMRIRVCVFGAKLTNLLSLFVLHSCIPNCPTALNSWWLWNGHFLKNFAFKMLESGKKLIIGWTWPPIHDDLGVIRACFPAKANVEPVRESVGVDRGPGLLLRDRFLHRRLSRRQHHRDDAMRDPARPTQRDPGLWR